jgi:hypothetical protein
MTNGRDLVGSGNGSPAPARTVISGMPLVVVSIACPDNAKAFYDKEG